MIHTILRDSDGTELEIFINTDDKAVLTISDNSISLIYEFENLVDLDDFISQAKKVRKELSDK